MAAGFGVARLLGFGESSLQAAIVAGLTLAAGSSGRLRTALPVAAILGVIVVVYSTLGALTTGYPFAAALAMAFVAFSTSVMTAARPVGLLIGMVASYAYFLVTGDRRARAEGDRRQPEPDRPARAWSDWGRAWSSSPSEPGASRPSAPHRRRPSEAARPVPAGPDPRRPSARSTAMPRTACAGPSPSAWPCSRSRALGTHNAFWVMLTVFVILAPNGRTTLQKAAFRVVGTLVGVVGDGRACPRSSPSGGPAPRASSALALSLAASTRSTTVSAAFGAAAAATLTAFPTGDFVGYAAARLVDTLIGAALALAAGYLLWPRSRAPGRRGARSTSTPTPPAPVSARSAAEPESPSCALSVATVRPCRLTSRSRRPRRWTASRTSPTDSASRTSTSSPTVATRPRSPRLPRVAPGEPRRQARPRHRDQPHARRARARRRRASGSPTHCSADRHAHDGVPARAVPRTGVRHEGRSRRRRPRPDRARWRTSTSTSPATSAPSAWPTTSSRR